MKKQFIKVKDFANLAKIKRQINDALNEKGGELKEALTALITELDSSEVEVDEQAFAEQVSEVIKKYMSDPEAEVPAAVADAIAKKIQAVKDSIQKTAGDKLPLSVKNEIAREIIFAKVDKASIENSVKNILVKKKMEAQAKKDAEAKKNAEAPKKRRGGRKPKDSGDSETK